MQLLYRQVETVNFAPLKSRFLNLSQAPKIYLLASEGLAQSCSKNGGRDMFSEDPARHTSSLQRRT